MVYQMLLFLIDCKTIKNERIEGIFYSIRVNLNKMKTEYYCCPIKIGIDHYLSQKAFKQANFFSFQKVTPGSVKLFP